MPQRTVESCDRLNAQTLWAAAKARVPRAALASELRCLVRRGSSKQPVQFDLVPCRYGGVRAFFVCPSEGCSRRVADLYAVEGVYRCRACHGLAYRSQQLRPADRARQRRDKIVQRLQMEGGWATLPATFLGTRPKGMWRRTYARLVVEGAEAQNRVMLAVVRALAFRRVAKDLDWG